MVTDKKERGLDGGRKGKEERRRKKENME